jgi:hypothetical protein
MRTIGTLLVVGGLVCFLPAVIGILGSLVDARLTGLGFMLQAFTWFPGVVGVGLGCLLRLAFKPNPRDHEPMPPPRLYV